MRSCSTGWAISQLFFDDAVAAAEALDIALTKRGSISATTSRCAVCRCTRPRLPADAHSQGFRVAVCEQMEDPAEARSAARNRW